MGRAKLEMKYIAREKTRNTTYEKRKNGMIKKASEFKTLCDVDTAMIIFPPNSGKIEIWPDNPDMIKKSIAFYKSKEENKKRMYGLKDYFEERKRKIEGDLLKTRKRNLEAKYATWFDELDGLSEGQLRHFAMGLEEKENSVREYLELKRRVKFETSDYFQYEVGGGSSSHVVDHYNNNNNNHNQINMMNHGFGWVDHGALETTTFVPMKSEVGGGYGYGHGYGYGGYPMFEGGGGGGVVYGNNDMNQWMSQPPVVQGGGVMMPEELEMQSELIDPQVNNHVGGGGVGEFVMGDYRGRFMG